MDEVKTLKSLVYLGLYFLVFYILYNHVFDNDYGFIAFLVPIGTNILRLFPKYIGILKKQKKEDFVVLRQIPLEFSDFTGAILTISIIIYIQDSFLFWLIPLLLTDLILVYFIKRKQFYYFGKWSIKDLSSTDENILIKEIKSLTMHPNKLEIHYIKEDDDERKKFFIRRDHLDSPNSWYAFEKIVEKFKRNMLEKEALRKH